jgi:hypothetical protein
MNDFFIRRSFCPGCRSADVRTLKTCSFTESPLKEYLLDLYKDLGPGIVLEFLDGSEFILDECSNCGLVYQNQVPNSLLLKKIYDEWIDPKIVHEMYKKNRRASYFLWLAQETTRVLEYLDQPPASISFLDFGMGLGNWCMIAKGFGCDVYGMDLADTRMDRARELGIKSVFWEELGNHKFDFINAEQVFEHLIDPLETLIMLKNSLKPEGIIRINVPPGWDVKRRLDIWNWQAQTHDPDWLNMVSPLQHVNCYNYNALSTMGVVAGLSVVEIANLAANRTRKSFCDKLKQAIKPMYYAIRPSKRHSTSDERRGHVFLTH